ncbi:hypothetical protein Ciccas_004144 [Cichlidogyrus casuarinus]|uniref:Uncharacterized protein n=1 Tax=Cichlidogyrus casuarinus TaxID=1844966 RepID=A0ABD2QCF0_9PLAT
MKNTCQKYCKKHEQLLNNFAKINSAPICYMQIHNSPKRSFLREMDSNSPAAENESRKGLKRPALLLSNDDISTFLTNKPKKPCLNLVRKFSPEIVPPLSLKKISPDTYQVSPTKESKKIEFAIKETYQIGFIYSSSSDDQVYVFDFVDALDVEYPLNVRSDVKLETVPPLMFGDSYREKLDNFSDKALQKLTDNLLEWLSLYKKFSLEEFTYRSVACYRRVSVLRDKAFKLMQILDPGLKIPKGFDKSSPDVEKLLYRVISQLNCDKEEWQKIADKERNSQINKQPLIAISADGSSTVQMLEHRILHLIKSMLPRLTLPPNFNMENDLPDLLDAILSLNEKPVQKS